MKIRATRKEFRNSNVLKVGYCKLQNLLQYENAFAYSAGVNGWNCDYYELNNFNLIISTGYRPHGKDSDPEVLKHYDNTAYNIASSNVLSYEEKKTLIQNLLKDFIHDSNIYK